MTVLDVIKYNDIVRQLIHLITPRPLAEYHEGMGPVLWWCLEPPQETKSSSPIPARWLGEPPYVGSPNDLGFTVEGELKLRQNFKERKRKIAMMVGGWPGYHTHFTPLPPMPEVPNLPERKFTGPGHLEETGYTDAPTPTTDPATVEAGLAKS